MAAKQNTVMALIPMDKQENTALSYRSQPDSKEFQAIFSEQQRHQWIMQAARDKTNLAVTLALEIDKHVTHEVRDLIIFMHEELAQTAHMPEVHATLLAFIQQDGREMVNEMMAIRKGGVQGIYEAVRWSLNILPPEEHRTFWDWLLGRKR